MIDEEKLPTDSLYKMLTIGGLVLVTASIMVFWNSISMDREIDEKRLEISLKSREAFSDLALRMFELKSRLRVLEKKTGTKPFESNHSFSNQVDGKAKNDLATWLSEIEYFRDRILNIELEKDFDKDSTEKCRDQLRYLEESVMILDKLEGGKDHFEKHTSRREELSADMKLASCILGVVGVYVFLQSSRAWYDRSQRFVDAILIKDATGEVVSKISEPTRPILVAIRLIVVLLCGVLLWVAFAASKTIGLTVALASSAMLAYLDQALTRLIRRD